MSDDAAQASYLFAKRTRREKTRFKILDGAVRCFVEQGFEGASFTELAKATGVTRALITHHFATKENLIQECIVYVGIQGKGFTDRFLAGRASLAPAIAYITATFAWFRDNPHAALFMIQAMQRAAYHGHTRGKVERIYAGARARIAQMLLEHPGERALSAPQAAETAHQIHATLVGMLVMAAMEPDALADTYEVSCLNAVRKLLNGSEAAKRP